MLCECGQRQATIHEVVIHHGHKAERHLCDQCAAQLGVTTDPQVPISQLISSYIQGKSMAVPSVGDPDKGRRPKAPGGGGHACPGCSMTFAAFKKHGLIGCASCYEHFAARLGPLIARAHEGAEQHIGKIPQRALREVMDKDDSMGIHGLIGSASERERRLASVRSRLAHALDHEEYEQAAMLRDELTRIASLPSAQLEARPESPAGAAAPPDGPRPDASR